MSAPPHTPPSPAAGGRVARRWRFGLLAALGLALAALCTLLAPELAAAKLDGARWQLINHETPARMSAGEQLQVELTIRNTGTLTWTPGQRDRVAYHWLAPDGRMIEYDGRRTELPNAVAPGDAVTLLAFVVAPAQPGEYKLRWEPLREGEGWYGPSPAGGDELVVVVGPARPSWDLLAVDMPPLVQTRERSRARVRLRNASAMTWEPGHDDRLAYRWLDARGEPVVRDGLRTELRAPLAPGEERTIVAELLGPDEPGRYVLEWEPLREGVRWYGRPGVDAVGRLEVQVLPGPTAWALESCALPEPLHASDRVSATVELRNIGARALSRAKGDALAHRWRPADGGPVIEGGRAWLSRPIATGALGEVELTLTTPRAPGRYDLEWSLVREGRGWFPPARSDQPLAGILVEAPRLAWELVDAEWPQLITVNRTRHFEVELRNTGAETWSPERGDKLSYHWLDHAGEVVEFDGLRSALPHPVAPGETVRFPATLRGPASGGAYILQLDMVREDVAWYTQRGGGPGAPPAAVRVLWRSGVQQLALLLLTVAAIVLARRRVQRSPAPRDALLHAALPALWVWAATVIIGLTFAELSSYELWRGALWFSMSSAALSAALVLMTPARGRARLWVAFLWVALLSTLTLADLIYIHFCGSIVPIQALIGSRQVLDVTSSVGAVLGARHGWLLPAPLAGLALALLWPRAPAAAGAPDRGRRRGRRLTALVVALALFPMTCRFTQIMTSDLGHRVFSEQRNVGRLGILGAHLFDLLRTARESLGRGQATPAERDALVETFTARAAETQRAVARTPAAADFGVAAGHNLLMIQVESLQGWVVGAEVDGQPVTPFLNSLRQRARYYPEFVDITSQGMTSDAEYAALNSQYPLERGALAFLRASNDFYTLAHVLRARGYTTLSAHPFRRGFWNRALLHPRYGFERSLFRRELGEGTVVGWGLADGLFFTRVLPELEALAARPEPFFAFLITLSVHHPYDDFPDALKELELAASGLEGTALGNYLHGMRYMDRSVAALLTELDARGLSDDTVVVLYGDHDARLGTPPELLELAGVEHWSPSVPKRLERVPAFVILPAAADNPRLRGPLRVVGSHVDLAPTALHYLGVPAPTSFLGRPLVAGVDNFAVLPDGSAVARDRSFVATGLTIPGRGACFHLSSGSYRSDADCEALAASARALLTSSRALLDYNLARVVAGVDSSRTPRVDD
ncbi:MAG: sulfatase-like hydrolase/transferase [Myxococcales bacterium]|nr:sulfatase-like hydrolase/transferase [Myxococcales bacterium]